MKKSKSWFLITVLLLSSCSSMPLKSEHSEKTEQSLKESQELDQQIQEDMKTLGIDLKKKTEESTENQKPSSSAIINPLPTDERNLAFVRFNVACWNLDDDQVVSYEEDVQVEAFSDYVIVIKDKNGQDKSLPPLCLMEATERFTNVPFSQAKLNFECLFDNNIIVGKNFSVVRQLSPSILWLIDPSNGQNFVLTTKLCQLVQAQ